MSLAIASRRYPRSGRHAGQARRDATGAQMNGRETETAPPPAAVCGEALDERRELGEVGQSPGGDPVGEDLAQLVGAEDVRLGHRGDLVLEGVDVGTEHVEGGRLRGDRGDRLLTAGL